MVSSTHRRLFQPQNATTLGSRDRIMAEQMGERDEGVSEVSDATTLQSPKAISYVPSEQSVASHYGKLDAERTHFCRELCSWAAMRDTVRFVFWLCVGIGVDWSFEELDDSFPTIFELIQWTWVFLSASGIIIALQINNWWMLGFCTGGSVSLLQRDLATDRQWHCINDYLQLAYSNSQRFAQILGPAVAWWCVMTSCALDRAHERTAASADCRLDTRKSRFHFILRCFHFIFGRPLRDWHGFDFDTKQESLRLKLVRKGKHYDELQVFFQREHLKPKPKQRQSHPSDSDDCIDSDDGRGWSDSDGSLDFDLEPDPSNQISSVRWDKFRNSRSSMVDEFSCVASDASSEEESANGEPWYRDAVLLYSAQGHHVRGVTGKNGNFTVQLREQGQYKRIQDAPGSLPMYLIVGSPGTTQTIAWRSIGASPPRRSVSQIVLCAFLPVLALLVVAYLNPWGLGGYVSIMYMILPDLVHIYLQNQTLQEDDPLTRVNETAADRQQEAVEVIRQGWMCISDNDRLVARLALWDSAFLYVGCLVLLLIGCYRLHIAAESLDMLRDLLHVPQQTGSDRCWAMTMYRLLQIRTKISHRRCLQHVAARAFPPESGHDKSLSWWFRTRAAIFGDISLVLEKRKPILLFYLPP